MADGDTITEPYQAEIRGLSIAGLCDSSPCPTYPLLEMWKGLGVPASRASTFPASQAHGSAAGPQRLTERTLTTLLGIRQSTKEQAAAAAAALAAAFSPVDPDLDAAFLVDEFTIPLVFSIDAAAGMGLPTGVYRVVGQPGRLESTYDLLLATRDGPVSFLVAAVEFVATDPRIYANQAAVASITPGSSSGGLGFPFAFPFAFGSASPGSAQAINLGNFKTFLRATITAGVGGLTGFTITHDRSGDMFGVQTVINQGETIVVDTRTRTVLLNGTADRRNAILRPGADDWLEVWPSVNNYALGTSGGAGPHTMDLEWRHAWML